MKLQYRKQATELLQRIRRFEGVVTEDQLVELIRKELIMAGLDGALEGLKGNK